MGACVALDAGFVEAHAVCVLGPRSSREVAQLLLLIDARGTSKLSSFPVCMRITFFLKASDWISHAL